jgi:hypothetical protein
MVLCAAVAAAAPAGASAAHLRPDPVWHRLGAAEGAAWGAAALRALGAPRTAANITTMRLWFANEGVPHAYDNPLNLQTPHGGSWATAEDGDPLSDRIQHYPRPPDFAAAFRAEMLRGGIDGPHQAGPYAFIVAGLRSGRGLAGDRSPGLRRDLEAYSGGGYGSVPAAYCPC